MDSEVEVVSTSYSKYDGKKAVEDLISKVDEFSPEKSDLAICLSSYSFNIDKLREQLSKKLGDTPILGATTAGEITNKGSSTGKALLMLINSENIQFKTASQEGLYQDAFKTGKEAAKQVVNQDFIESEKNKLLFVLNTFDTIKSIGPEKQMLDGIDEVLGSEAPLVGGCAGDDWTFKGSKVFTEEKVIDNGVVMASLETDYSIQVDQKSGADEKIATGVITEVDDGNRGIAKKINGEPAAEWYSKQIDVPVRKLSKIFSLGGKKEDIKFMSGVTPKIAKKALKGQKPNLVNDVLRYAREYPFADYLTPADNRIRLPVQVTSENGLRFARAPVYENLELDLLKSDSKKCRNSAVELFEEDDSETIFGFVADCGNRWFLLDEDDLVDQEAELLRQKFEAPFIGFYSYGELGGQDKYNCNFKMQTLTSFKISKEKP